MVNKTAATKDKAQAEEAQAELAQTGTVVINNTTTALTASVSSTALAVAADLDFEADAGVGAETIGKDDLALPFFSILQDLSPQTKKSKPEYVEGAKPGMFFNSVTKQVWEGDPASDRLTEDQEAGVIWVPALYAKTFIEWVPNQGGFVADHGLARGQQLAETCTRDDKGKLILPNGNELIETAYHFGLIVDLATGTAQEALYTAKSSGLKESRRWNTMATGIKLQGRSGPFTPAMAYMSYKLTTKEVSNDEGTWAALVVNSHVPTIELKNGKGLYQQAVAFAKLMSGNTDLMEQVARRTGGDADGGAGAGSAGASADVETAF